MCIPGGGRTHGLPLTPSVIHHRAHWIHPLWVEGGRVIHCATGMDVAGRADRLSNSFLCLTFRWLF
jgi:hypothetical protein